MPVSIWGQSKGVFGVSRVFGVRVKTLNCVNRNLIPIISRKTRHQANSITRCKCDAIYVLLCKYNDPLGQLGLVQI